MALKVLPPELAESEERRARFTREAKAIAALDHPNIVQVFSVEEAEGIHFITMQLVHVKTLTELLPKNGFSLNWWRRRESNPRPKIFIRSLYMRVRIPFISLPSVRNRQKPDESYLLSFAEHAERMFD